MKTKAIVLFLFALTTASLLFVWKADLCGAPVKRPTASPGAVDQPSADTTGKPKTIQIEPSAFTLAGKWASQTLLVTARLSNGQMRDLSWQAEFHSRDAKIAQVSKEGVVTPISDGQTTIVVTAQAGGATLTAEVQVAVKHAKRDSADFLHDVMPLVSRLGCNAAACHGSPKGKGGLTFSMFGADPPADYEALTKADGGRRVDKVRPLKSLFLLKATGSIPHKPKQKLQVGSPAYRLLAAWVAQGAPLSREDPSKLVSLQLSPKQRILHEGETQQLLATAVYSDGSRKDVTHSARFNSSEEGVAAVDQGGRVTAGNCGEATIVVTYLRQPATASIIIPQPLSSPFPPLAANNPIDEKVYAKLKLLGIPPAQLCSDQEFLRRVFLDVTGTLPSGSEARAYLADRDPHKRRKLIDRLLASEEFADFWAMKWSDLFRVKSEFPVNLWPNAAEVYHRWIRVSIANNKPYDQFARELITATGSNFRVPQSNFYRAFLKREPQSMAEVTALIFMGARVGCARCHGHPTENWTLDDNLGLAAFFAQLRFKPTMQWKEEIVYLNPIQTMRHPRTGELIKPKILGGEVLEVEDGQDGRAKFAAWLTSPDNPWFARNIVNRVWFWLLGRGIVHEPDDLRPTNPPENPQLLDWLAKDLVSHKYDLKHVYRLILNSQTYQRSSQANAGNRDDVAHFSHYYVKRLGAETLLDAIGQVTGQWDTYRSIIPEPFVVMPTGFRATHLADGSVSLPFLELFGRPPRDTAYESDRDLQLYLRQTLHLLNSNDVQGKISISPWLVRLLKEQAGNPSKIIEEMYLTTLSRPPRDAEVTKITPYLAAAGKSDLSGVQAEQKAAQDALADVRQQRAKANAEYEAAGKTAKASQATAAQAKEWKLANAAKIRRDKLAVAEKAATAQFTKANNRLNVAKAAANARRDQAFQDLLWALINTKEFVFNH
jgi:hypothetical protein